LAKFSSGDENPGSIARRTSASLFPCSHSAENPSLALEDMTLESGDRAALLLIPSDELKMQETVLHHKRFAEAQLVLAAA
jgi:hypothetical protein